MPELPIKEELAELIAPGRSWSWRLKKFINIIDDPIDWVKEALHGMHLPFGYELNISCLMANRKTTWDIIRKQGNYSNSDPEDITKDST